MSRIALTLLLSHLPASLMALSPQSLDDHRWKHRLLVIPRPSTEMQELLQKNHAGLHERHVQTILLPTDATQPIHREIAKRFRFTAEDKDILLIGKDGRTTVRWKQHEFTFPKLFQRIDAMPMRQREMETR